MEFQEISTQELSSIFANDEKFADEEGFTSSRDKLEKDQNIADDDLKLYDDLGDEINLSDIMEDDDDDYSEDDVSPLTDASSLDDDAVYSIDGENYEVGQIEKAITAYKDISMFQDQVSQHMANLEEAEQEFNKLQALAYGQIDVTLEYWQQVAESPKTNNDDYRRAMNEIRACEAQKREIEQQYAKSREVMNAKKAEAERLKGATIRNELVHSHGWNTDDFQAATDYIRSNGINLKGEAVSTSLLLALRKAAAFDAKRLEVQVDSEEKVVKALRSKSPSKPSVAPQNTAGSDQAKRKAKAKAERGELSQSDMFRFLED
ncbi:hypothetical protein PL222_00840 [Salmonella enterica]|uniref:hypothetical protein n=1 Tax=Salmonella enterica TaxID=28901 RepID=UPI0026DD9EC0|nr:hypothetical protein [Salmonella enterica]MDO3814244.1 hypothetical protein [Salmonella enterica]MDO3823298.1 hypothetical protein [Salmonella enterica]